MVTKSIKEDVARIDLMTEAGVDDKLKPILNKIENEDAFDRALLLATRISSLDKIDISEVPSLTYMEVLSNPILVEMLNSFGPQELIRQLNLYSSSHSPHLAEELPIVEESRKETSPFPEITFIEETPERIETVVSLPPISFIEETPERPSVEPRRSRVERARRFARERETIKRKPVARVERARIVETAPPPSPFASSESQVVRVIHETLPRWYDYDREFAVEARPIVEDINIDPSWKLIKEAFGEGGIVEVYASPEGYRVVDWEAYSMYGPISRRARAEEVFRRLVIY